MSQPQKRRGGLGCLPYGCLIAVMIVVFIGGGLLLYARSRIQDAVVTFTSDEFRPPQPRLVSDDARSQSANRLDSLMRLLGDLSSSGEVVLNEDDLALMIEQSPLKGTVSVAIGSDGTLTASSFSIPLKDMGDWELGRRFVGDFRNRYLNGSAAARVSAEDGKVSVSFTALTLNGHAFSSDWIQEADQYMTGFINFDPEAPDKPEGRFNRVERLWIDSEGLHIRVRAGG